MCIWLNTNYIWLLPCPPTGTRNFPQVYEGSADDDFKIYLRDSSISAANIGVNFISYRSFKADAREQEPQLNWLFEFLLIFSWKMIVGILHFMQSDNGGRNFESLFYVQSTFNYSGLRPETNGNGRSYIDRCFEKRGHNIGPKCVFRHVQLFVAQAVLLALHERRL